MVVAMNFPWLSNMNASRPGLVLLSIRSCKPCRSALLRTAKAFPAPRFPARRPPASASCPPGALLGDGARPAGADQAAGWHLCLPPRRLGHPSRRHLCKARVRPLPARQARAPLLHRKFSSWVLQVRDSPARAAYGTATRASGGTRNWHPLSFPLQISPASSAPLQPAACSLQTRPVAGIHRRL